VSSVASPARVVFADDDPRIRNLLSRLLGRLRHVTVVGEAEDGIAAVELVTRHYPDTVLLDVGMPLLDGFGAAEVIRSFRPQTQLLLHTAEISEERLRRAERLGVPLLDKMSLPATVELVEETAVAADHAQVSEVDPLVLLALAGRADEGVLVVKADESIPFYNPAFASVLDLPFPPETVTLGDLHGRGLVRRADGSALPLGEQPIVRAMTEGQVIAGSVFLRLADGELRPYTMACKPYFGPGGDLIGVANYVTDAGMPGQALAVDDPLFTSRDAPSGEEPHRH
jgi:CheY-like chemotaxis protein